MKDNNTSKEQTLDKSYNNPSNFKGYTLEELRYQRALTVLKRDFSQAKLLRNIENIKKTNPLTSSGRTSGNLPSKFGSVTSKVLSGLNYIDYAMLGFSLFKSVRKVYSFFHKK